MDVCVWKGKVRAVVSTSKNSSAHKMVYLPEIKLHGLLNRILKTTQNASKRWFQEKILIKNCQNF